MRGLYTAGVLDFLMDAGIWLSDCYGVSAGAVNATNYVSKQRGRTFRVTVNYINDKRYCSIRNWLRTGDLFGADFLYNRIPNELEPFDYDAFATSDTCMTAVVTNVATGKPTYRRLTDLRREMQWLRASCSLPMLANMVELDGRRYLDGGISDSIPLGKAIADGCEKNIVILTQHAGYQKKPDQLTAFLGSALFSRYPETLAAGKWRHVMYNRQLHLVEQEERAGNALVFRPRQSINIGRVEKDVKKLTALYEQGYADAKERQAEMIAFLGIQQPAATQA